MHRYNTVAILFHWLLAVLIVGAFTMGVVMTDMPGITPTKLKYFSWHKWTGITILLLAALRLLWRLKNGAPAYPASMPAWQKKTASGLHHLLYVLMFAVPLSGYFYSLAAGIPVVWFGVIPLPVLIDASPTLKPVLKDLHYFLNLGLLVLVLTHVGAALKHHFIDRDDILKRMLPKF